MTWLKQSTAVDIILGPFVDATDGVTAETALTISQADIRLSKNGAAFAQTNNAAGATHRENGHYLIPLNSTDTDTLGRLRVAVNESGALPCWRDFMVVPANVYDALVGNTDKLQVDTVEVSGTSQTAGDLKTLIDTVDNFLDTEIAAILAAVDTEVGAIKAVTDAQGATGSGLTAIPWNAAWDAEVQSEVEDALQTALAESYAADNANASVVQLLWLIQQSLLEFSVSGTTKTIKKKDGVTTAATATLDDATDPTSITRAS